MQWHASIGSILFLLPSAALAQSSAQLQPLPGPVRNAGVLHVATGTWDRGTQEAVGPRVLYNNNAAVAGIFGQVQDTQAWIDEGRLPSCDGPDLPAAIARSYSVDGIEISYCTSQPTGSGTTGISLAFYEAYASCTSPASLSPVRAFDVGGLPGGATCGSTACWTVTLDLEGTSFEFEILADGDGVFDDSTALNSFGWSYSVQDSSCGLAGPVIAGDPNNSPYGDGTYYQNPGATGTGLGGRDRFWITDSSGSLSNGCYWFGGYPGSAYASLWLQLIGDKEDTAECVGGLGEPYCQANPSSCLAPAELVATDQGDDTFELSVSPVPLEAGIFFHGSEQSQRPFGSGFLCATMSIVRLLPPLFPDASCGTAALKQDFGPYIGRGTRNFQYWFPDGASFNTSNAVSITFP